MPAFLTDLDTNLQAVWMAFKRIVSSVFLVRTMTSLARVLESVSLRILSGWKSAILKVKNIGKQLDKLWFDHVAVEPKDLHIVAISRYLK